MKSILFLSTFLLSSLFSFGAVADTKNVVTLTRLNYKAEKLLHFDVVYEAQTCQIDTTKPFDSYYIDTKIQKRVEFSSDSHKYFGPRLKNAIRGPHQVMLEFEAFDEIQNQVGAKAEILVTVENRKGQCEAWAQITYRDQSYILKHIDIMMQKTFGIPTGVKWVRLKGESEAGPIDDCVAGTCQ